jgi:hypothetical protein
MYTAHLQGKYMYILSTAEEKSPVHCRGVQCRGDISCPLLRMHIYGPLQRSYILSTVEELYPVHCRGNISCPL